MMAYISRLIILKKELKKDWDIIFTERCVYTDKNVFCLDDMICPCSTMYRVHPAYLLWVMEGLVAGYVINQIKVDDKIQELSKLSLQRMLDLPQ